MVVEVFFVGFPVLDSVHPPLQLIGVGPGDPELLTIAAVRAIEAADVIAYPVAKEAAAGMAWTIASRWARADQRRLPLIFPMVIEAEPRVLAWRDAADALASETRRGFSVVLLCEGDASLFASCSYVQLALRKRHLISKLIPEFLQFVQPQQRVLGQRWIGPSLYNRTTCLFVLARIMTMNWSVCLTQRRRAARCWR